MQFLIGKPSEKMSNFWTVRFSETESEPNIGFPHIPGIRQYYRNGTLKVNK